MAVCNFPVDSSLLLPTLIIKTVRFSKCNDNLLLQQVAIPFIKSQFLLHIAYHHRNELYGQPYSITFDHQKCSVGRQSTSSATHGQPTVTLCGQLAVFSRQRLASNPSVIYLSPLPPCTSKPETPPSRSIFENQHKIWWPHGPLRQRSVSLWPTLSCDIENILSRLPVHDVIAM